MADQALKDLSDHRRVLARQMIDLIAADQTFRDLILDDPVAAMEHGGLAEAHDNLVDEFFAVKVDPEAEVQGFATFSLGVAPIRPGGKDPIGGIRPQPTWVAAPSCSFPTTGGDHC